ncbi:hypothetical protein [Bailinhaonella thermotolerans]|uniref:Uncharacterized protein n=1 Tax=Bailinhaonella thermotolerans TaxID=1070861 RepID=A0A3A4B0M0_9ACTN|nr:hypothetical protein [Bailinhaonella thermotolerans]RJL31653.1 hypothetical protein D5H75_18245 [Bailinhaonella thermotolerans]
MIAPVPAHAAGPRVVLIGVPGLAWDDITPEGAPALHALTASASPGGISARAVANPSCPVDGWLTISAGTLADGADASCPSPREPGPDLRVPGWDTLRAVNGATIWKPPLGRLADAVARAGGCVTAVGPGAALAAADSTGRVARYARTVAEADFAACPVTIVAAGEIAEAYAGGREVTAARRAEAVRRADATVAAALGRAPEGATRLVTAVSDTEGPHLRPAFALGPAPGGGEFGSHVLTSPSTRRAGLVKVTDLTSTVLDAAGAPRPEGLADVAWRPSGVERGPDTAGLLSSADRRSRTVQDLAGPFFVAVGIAHLLAYGLLALAYRRTRGHGGPGRTAGNPRRERVLAAARTAAVVLGAVPVAMHLVNLLPWSLAPVPGIGLIAGIALVVAVVAAFARGRRGPLGPAVAIAAVTAGTITLDLLTGSNLQIDNFNGLYPINAGRSFGLGNEAFAVYVTAVLLALAALGERLRAAGRPRFAAAAVLVPGLGAVAVVGSPSWGADFGGVLALTPGVLLLTLLTARVRLTVRRVGGAVAAGAVAVLGLAWLDSLRPSPTHFGLFWDELVTGRAGETITRKLAMMLGSLGGPWATLLVVLPVLALTLAMAYGTRAAPPALRAAYAQAPALRHALLAVWLTIAAGFALNDSGAAVPGLALLLAFPLTLSAAATAASPPHPPPVPAELPETSEDLQAPGLPRPAEPPQDRPKPQPIS